MKDVTVIGRSVTLASGALRLSAKQAAARAPFLRALKGDTYTIIAPVVFKQGESFGYDAEISKSLALVLEGGHRAAPARKKDSNAAGKPAAPPAAGKPDLLAPAAAGAGE